MHLGWRRSCHRRARGTEAGRVIRIKVESESTVDKILNAAVRAESGQTDEEYEPDLEDIFLLVMEKLGSEIKGSSELMTPEHTGES